MNLDSAELQILLVLWHLGKGNKKLTIAQLKKPLGERKTIEPDLLKLEKKGLLTLESSKVGRTTSTQIKLDPDIVRILQENIYRSGLSFKGRGTIIGKSKANAVIEALLAWTKDAQPVVVTPAKEKTEEQQPQKTIDRITSYDRFKQVFIEVFDRLNLEYNYKNLVPIYQIRRQIGDRVTREEFNQWTIQMQGDDILQLHGEGIEDGAPDKIRDSITTPVSGLRCFAIKK